MVLPKTPYTSAETGSGVKTILSANGFQVISHPASDPSVKFYLFIMYSCQAPGGLIVSCSFIRVLCLLIAENYYHDRRSTIDHHKTRPLVVFW